MSIVYRLSKMLIRPNKSKAKRRQTQKPVKTSKAQDIPCSMCGRPTKLFGKQLSESQADKYFSVMSLKCGKCGRYFCLTCIAQRIGNMPNEPPTDINKLSEYQIEQAIFWGVQKRAPCPKCKARRPKGPHDVFETAALANMGYVAFCDYHISSNS